MPVKLDKIFEDDYIIAINKDAGMLSIPDRFNPDLPNLATFLKDEYPESIPVHRLDKFTSGIILFAKTPEVHKILSADFEHRNVEKYYIAIVEGTPNPSSGKIDVALAESMSTRGKMVVNKRGKSSLSEYEVVQFFNRYSVVKVKLHTGRMHQIRVHMQHIGHPLVVDALYGSREELFLSQIKQKRFNIGKFEEERPLLVRQPLHAIQLIFTHPIDKNIINLEAQLPKDMGAVINQMQKWCKIKD